VFSVSGSPITTSGTLGLTFATGQTANQFLATPNGSTGAVALRSIVTADIPTGTSGGVIPLLNGNNTESGSIIFSAAAASTTPAVTLNGAPFAGSSSTATPVFFIQPSGTTETNLLAAGSYAGINCASGSTANALFLHVNSVNRFTVGCSGNISITGSLFFTGSNFFWSNLLMSQTAPTISSGFGTLPSIVKSNGTAVFTVNVGTGGTATTGVVAFPAASNGWACTVRDLTSNSSFVTDQTATTTTTVSVQNYSRTTGLPIAWTASDVILFSQCAGF